MEEDMIVMRDSTSFSFDFDNLKNFDENLKHKIEFIIKSNESSSENKIKYGIEQCLIKYYHGNNIHENRKQQNE